MSDFMRRVHTDGAVSRVHRWQTSGWDAYLQVNTGPPTWWRPQGVWRTPAESPRRGDGVEIMIGWLRCCVAVAFVRAKQEVCGMKYHPPQQPDPQYPPEMQHIAPARIKFDDGRVVDVRGMTEAQFVEAFDLPTVLSYMLRMYGTVDAGEVQGYGGTD